MGRSLRSLTLLGLVSLGVLPGRSTGSLQPTVQTAWSGVDQAAVAHVLALADGVRTLTLDLSDPLVAHFLRRHYEIAGLTAELYPGLHSLIDEHTMVHAVQGVTGPTVQLLSDDLQYEDLATLMLALYPTGTTTYAGNAVASFADASADPSQNLQISYASLCFYDDLGHPIGTCASQSSFGQGHYFPLSHTLTTSDQSFTGAFAATYYDTISRRYVAQLSTLELNTIEYPQMQTITNPVIVHSQNNPLLKALVCTSRQVNANANPGVCDYGTYSTTDVLISMGGSVTYKSNQTPKTSGGVLVGTGSVSLINQDSGGQCTLSPSISGASFFSQPQVRYDPATKTVSWDFTDLDFGSASSLICGADGTHIQFSLVLQVENDAAADTTIVASQNSVAGTVTPHLVGPNAGALATPMLALVAGCLHPATRIAMADGSTRAITELTGEGELIRSIGGVETHVVGTVGGAEATLFHITAGGGMEVLASAIHPFVTAGGDWVAASDLKPGDRVLGRDGPVVIISVVQVHYEGPVHNLILDRSPEALSRETATFYANGFLVGGHDAQQRLAQAKKAHPTRVEALLPQRFRVDYESHLQDGSGQ